MRNLSFPGGQAPRAGIVLKRCALRPDTDDAAREATCPAANGNAEERSDGGNFHDEIAVSRPAEMHGVPAM
jgi:hypothetical protein